MKKANDEVLAGKVPYITRERCWPAGVPGSLVFTRGCGSLCSSIRRRNKITIVNELNAEVRHIYLNVAHHQESEAVPGTANRLAISKAMSWSLTPSA
jgi:hypothetical protein